MSGRVDIAVSDPTDANVMYVGGQGGVWKTSNYLTTDGAGPTWIPLTDDFPSFDISGKSLAMFPNDPKSCTRRRADRTEAFSRRLMVAPTGNICSATFFPPQRSARWSLIRTIPTPFTLLSRATPQAGPGGRLSPSFYKYRLDVDELDVGDRSRIGGD